MPRLKVTCKFLAAFSLIFSAFISNRFLNSSLTSKQVRVNEQLQTDSWKQSLDLTLHEDPYWQMFWASFGDSQSWLQCSLEVLRLTVLLPFISMSRKPSITFVSLDVSPDRSVAFEDLQFKRKQFKISLSIHIRGQQVIILYLNVIRNFQDRLHYCSETCKSILG